MKTSGSIEIDRPMEDVFRLTTEHVADWSILVVEDEMIEEKPGGSRVDVSHGDRRTRQTDGV